MDCDLVHKLFDHGRAAWPGIQVELETFTLRLGVVDAGTTAADPERAYSNARDLYLACACSEGNNAALAAFEQHYLSIVKPAVRRIDGSADFCAEVLQVLRERLLVGPSAKIREYRGSGPLAGWVRTAAVRTALNLRRPDRRGGGEREADLLGARMNPEMAFLHERHRADIAGALQRSLARLSTEERLLLRYYYVDDLTLAKTAVLLDVGISTVFRRLTAATQAVLSGVREELAEKLALSTETLDSLIRDLHQEIDLSLSQILGGPGT